MANGRAIIESSSYDGVLILIDSIKAEYPTVWYTDPIKTADGKFLSSVHYSQEIITVGENVDHLRCRIL